MKGRELLDALETALRLKDVTRHCYTAGGRRESVAEHSWSAALTAYFIKDEFPGVDMDRVIKGIMAGSMDDIVAGMGNVLESVTCAEYDIIDKLKKSMLESGAAGSLMSGSGPTVFGLFNKKEEALSAEARLKELYPDVFVKATGIIR